LGRELGPGDFPPLPLNDDHETDTVRLRLAKGSGRVTKGLYALARDAVVELGCSREQVAQALRLDLGMLDTWVDHRRTAEGAPEEDE
jgi:hypothetical protein